ncbi:MAG TPA: cupredoxin domain-containing protein, partial [Xanthobacteraceae bacterium]|nr:cupredoxin domain-containing protein [Xanthobacteraceae bacterium]
MKLPGLLRGALAAALLLALASALPAAARAAELEVKIDNFTFAPQRITVKAGTTVTWTNEDDIP